MNNDKLVLKDCTEITLQSSQGMNALRVNVADKAAACVLWEKFSKENVKQITVKNSEGVTVGSYQDMVLDHVEGRDNSDGTVQMTFFPAEQDDRGNIDRAYSCTGIWAADTG